MYWALTSPILSVVGPRSCNLVSQIPPLATPLPAFTAKMSINFNSRNASMLSSVVGLKMTFPLAFLGSSSVSWINAWDLVPYGGRVPCSGWELGGGWELRIAWRRIGLGCGPGGRGDSGHSQRSVPWARRKYHDLIRGTRVTQKGHTRSQRVPLIIGTRPSHSDDGPCLGLDKH